MEELREQIASILSDAFWDGWEHWYQQGKDYPFKEKADQILALVKEAGYQQIPDVNKLVMLVVQLEEIGYRGVPLADRVHRFLMGR